MSSIAEDQDVSKWLGLLSRHLMRNVILLAWSLASLLMLSGCFVRSVNPLYEERAKDPDVVMEKSLIGSWSIAEEKCQTTLTITVSDDLYDLRSVEGKDCNDPGQQVHRQARLVKLDNWYFLDSFPLAEEVCDDCLPLHWIFRAKLDKDTLSLTPMDSTGVKQLSKDGGINLKTLPEDPKPSIFESQVILISLSKELKSFCRRYAADKAVFKDEATDVFKRI